ncbi:hypothetical protein [Methylomonas koyamae]|uniref:hypothetical protein n=1 Tax=Methylomonas koyamae TaxID=702114 RepID=UPI00112EB610|nr:hypothetical protein [Methylomonas koyamae]
MISCHTGENKDDHQRIKIIVDNDNFNYSPFAADCEIIDRKILIIAAPFYSNSVFVMKSIQYVEKKLYSDITRGSRDHVMEHNRSLKMLTLLRDCLESNECTVNGFLEKLKTNKSSLYEPVLHVLPFFELK